MKFYKVLLILGLLLFIIPFIIELVHIVNPSSPLFSSIENSYPILKHFHTNSFSIKADLFVLLPAMFLALIITLARYERGRILLLQVILIKLIFDLLITPIIILRAPQLLTSDYILLLVPYLAWYLIITVATMVIVWVKKPFPDENFRGTIISDIEKGIVEPPEYFTGNIKEVHFR